MSTTTPTPAASTNQAGEGTTTTTVASPAEGAPASTAVTPPADGTATKKDDSAAKPAAEVKPDTPPAAPEKYELKLDEGSHLKPEQVEEFSAYAKSKGLTQEQAQELLTREDKAVRSYADAEKQTVEAEIENWKQLASQDKEIGGEALPQNVEHAKRALDRYGNDTFRGMLDKTGFGNHPEVIRFFSKIGKAMSQDQMIKPGAQGGPSIQSMEEKFYPKNK